MRTKTIETKNLLRKCKIAFTLGHISVEQYQATLILLFDNMSIIEDEKNNIDFIINFLNKKTKDNPLFENFNFSICLN